MCKWSFPNNGFGQITGVANAGIEFYRGDEIKSLAREICQNSLDARISDDKPVRVEFVFATMPSSNVAGIDEYREVLNKAYNYWTEEKNQKAMEFLTLAKKECNRDNIDFLRISDYNTKGLLWAYGNKADGWNALTKIDGGATKSGDEAGSFGIGKNAPFCNSYFRVVYYRTLNLDGERAAQGVARIMSFPENNADPLGSMTTGVGYYGNPERNKPVEKIDFLDGMAMREEVGSDVFVCGFRMKSNWKDDICKAIIQNFAVSVAEGRLEVIVGDERITSKTLEKYVKKFSNSEIVSVFSVLSQKDRVKEYTKKLLGGTFRLRLLVNEKNDDSLNRKILVVRKVGMKLFNYKKGSTALTYSGILDLQGEELSKFFRNMENPTHDKWEPKKHPDPELAKQYLKALEDWLEGIFKELVEEVIGEEIVVMGLGNILSKTDHDKTGNPETGKKEETLSNHLEDIEVMVVKKKIPARGIVFGKGKTSPEDKTTKTVPGIVDPNGTDPTVRTLVGVRKRKKKVEHKGMQQEDGKDKVKIPQRSMKELPINGVRIIKIKQFTYKIVMRISREISKGHLEIVTIGENGGSGRLFVNGVHKSEGCDEAIAQNGVVSFSKMKANEKVSLEIELTGQNDYAMGVSVHEHS